MKTFYVLHVLYFIHCPVGCNAGTDTREGHGNMFTISCIDLVYCPTVV